MREVALRRTPWLLLFLAIVVTIFLLVYGFSGKPPVPADPKATALLEQLEAAGDLIVATEVEGTIPIDPASPAWEKAKEYSVPLVPQVAVTPSSTAIRRLNLRVRAIYSDDEVGIHLSWEDKYKDTDVTKAEYFRDAVAVEFPMTFKSISELPYVGMGNKGRPVNVWHWKASWQADIEKGFQGVVAKYRGRVPQNSPQKFRIGANAGSPFSKKKRTSPVENILAEGFGTITSVPLKSLSGKGIFKNGGWQVVMVRDLEADEDEGVSYEDAVGMVPIAFAVWDGKVKERNGNKMMTRWRFLKFEKKNVPLAQLQPIIIKPIPGSNVKKGKKLVAKLKCNQCHLFRGETKVLDPGNVGPNLSYAGAMYRPEYLLESLLKPSAVLVPDDTYYYAADGTSKMPFYDETILAKADYKHIVEYMRTLK